MEAVHVVDPEAALAELEVILLRRGM